MSWCWKREHYIANNDLLGVDYISPLEEIEYVNIELYIYTRKLEISSSRYDLLGVDCISPLGV
jgi:hypothetical protein